MSVVIPPAFAEASIEMRHDSDPDPWYITFGVDLSGAGGDYNDAALNIRRAWALSFGPELSDEVTTTAVTLRVGQDGDDPVIFRLAIADPGTSDVAKLPQNCALLVTKQTSLGGRKHRGRMFIPAILSESRVSGTGIIEPALVLAYEELANEFRLALLEGNENLPPTPMVILHNEYVPQPPPTLVTGLSPSGLISTQRRRLR